jgi:hypothetical protein
MSSLQYVVFLTLLGVALCDSVRTETIFTNVSRFPYDHMTMVERVSDNVFLMCWQASHSGEGAPDQRIVLSKSLDGGQSWDQPRDIVFGNNMPVWGPALIFQRSTETLFLYYAASVPQNIRPPSDHHFPGGQICLRTSQDFGETWSDERILMHYDSASRGNVSKMTANKPIFLSQDEQSWGLPFWQEPHADNKNDTGKQCAGLLITRDGGQTHEPYGCVSAEGTWVIENSVVPLTQIPASAGSSSLTLQMFFRTQKDFLYESFSYDGGFSWSNVTVSSIPNPDSKAYAAASLDESFTPTAIFLACNPLTRGRGLLSLLVSCSVQQDKQRFQSAAVLENNTNYAWDYPTVQIISGPDVSGDWVVAVSYSALSHSAVDIAWIQGTCSTGK